MKKPAITLISASAGSGKTYSLIRTLVEHLDRGGRPDAFVATTFTNKAAAELTERVRTRLLECGRRSDAQLVLDGYIGTVNSVCGRLLKEFALEAGLSPTLDVLPDGEDQAAFERAIASIVEKYAADIAPIAGRFEMEDWRVAVMKICNTARINSITPEALVNSGDRSWKAMRQLLQKPFSSKDGSVLDRRLMAAIETAIDKIHSGGDETKGTASAIELMKRLQRVGQDQPLNWPDWARLSKIGVSKASAEHVDVLQKEAANHTRHPRLHEDLEAFIQNVFRCAAEALSAYADFKKAHGLIDFIDQESLCLGVIQRPDVKSRLREKLERLYVDEFQDTSPIQLALFLELTKTVGQSVWVGDQKQAIFGFRGTDPALMDAVIENLTDPAALTILPDSYRSRPDIVAFTSSLFAEAFKAVGIPAERVHLKAKRKDEDGQAPALHVWRLEAKKISEESAALAASIRQVLAQGKKYVIFDKSKNVTRPLRGGDIAILCRTNKKCADVAEALEANGIRATIPRGGLMSRPECALAFACLRYLVDPADTIAKAEILHFTEDPPGSRQWFTGMLEGNDYSTHAVIKALDERRDSLTHLTPSEAFDEALDAASIYRRTLSWDSRSQRLSNIEEMRRLSRTYEEHCRVQRSAGTPAGLVAYLSPEVRGTDLDMQAECRDENGVQIVTYHRAKGLEWPVVVLCDLASKAKSDPFGVHTVQPDRDFDPLKPLTGRWIRYWPWPYGAQKKDVGIDDAVAASKEKAQTSFNEQKELTRLLYVGMTRARDYLILTARDKGKDTTAWLDSIVDKDGAALLALPAEDGLQKVKTGGKTFKVNVSHFTPQEPVTGEDSETAYAFPVPTAREAYLPSHIAPSGLSDYPPHLSVRYGEETETIRLGDRIPLNGDVAMDHAGSAIHAFLSVDNPTKPADERHKTAERILKNWDVSALEPPCLVKISDRLRTFLGERYRSGFRLLHEWPVALKIGHQKATGWIDLLVETKEGYVIIDHKSFPGPMTEWSKKALQYRPQLALYKAAVEKALERPVLETLIHMPIAGAVLTLRDMPSG